MVTWLLLHLFVYVCAATGTKAKNTTFPKRFNAGQGLAERLQGELGVAPLADTSSTAGRDSVDNSSPFDFRGGDGVLSVRSSNGNVGCNQMSKRDVELYNAINTYRVMIGLPSLPLSKSLSAVARYHVIELTKNPEKGSCTMHSWLGDPPPGVYWRTCCYAHVSPDAECMWRKPSEITNVYTERGYEISLKTSHKATGYKVDEMLRFWKGSPSHNSVIANNGAWKQLTWRAMGVAIHDIHVNVWFGEQVDPAGECSVDLVPAGRTGSEQSSSILPEDHSFVPHEVYGLSESIGPCFHVIERASGSGVPFASIPDIASMDTCRNIYSAICDKTLGDLVEGSNALRMACSTEPRRSKVKVCKAFSHSLGAKRCELFTSAATQSHSDWVTGYAVPCSSLINAS